MNTLIQVNPVEERSVNYLKGIHKKCRNILLSCIILNSIAFLIGLFFSEKNTDDASFRLFLFFFIFIVIVIKFGFPLFFAITSFFWYKKTKEKWALVVSVICICVFFYSISSIAKNILIYGP